ncbi:uncharacterized protein [Nicotiana tomentosiformis]|uniref:uncharacterized protein n=1 Tax=Nicotiana tomentosiformis TaxID=4098 RepID=UPI00388C523C
MDLLKDYDITILYHPTKANVVADALSRNALSMGILAFIHVGERPIVIDVQTLANQFVRLDVSKPSRDTVQHGHAKDVTIANDGMLRMQSWICVPNVDGLREVRISETRRIASETENSEMEIGAYYHGLCRWTSTDFEKV